LIKHTGDPGGGDSPRAEDPLGPLVRRAAAGERQASRELIHAVGPAMLRAVRKVMGHRSADVEDGLQEAVEGFLESLGAFKGQCTVLHFACRVAVLSALSSRRRATFRNFLSQVDFHRNFSGCSPIQRHATSP
jgi:RNA polymerase sigma-70 factor (ECF subfamily)